MSKIQAVVLDWAGTTVDFGSRAPALVFQSVFKQKEVDITLAHAREPMGMAKREHIAAVGVIPAVAKAWQERWQRPFGEEDIDQLYDDFIPRQKAVLAEYSDLIPGVVGAIDQLRRRNIRIGSTTGYTRELMEIVSPIAKAQGYEPDLVLCADDAPRGRPAPFLLYQTAITFDLFPMDTFVKVDDTPVGIKAGRHAGCWTVGISRTGNGVGLSQQELEELPTAEQHQRIATAAASLKEAGAHFVIESVAELPALLTQIEGLLDAGHSPSNRIENAHSSV